MSDLKKIIVVVNPTKDSELGDILFDATPTDLYFIAKGTTQDPSEMNIKFYSLDDVKDAIDDANQRMKDVL